MRTEYDVLEVWGDCEVDRKDQQQRETEAKDLHREEEEEKTKKRKRDEKDGCDGVKLRQSGPGGGPEVSVRKGRYLRRP